MSKSKIKMPKEVAHIAPLVESLQNIVTNLEHYSANSTNKISSIYTIASFVRVFAYQKARLDKIREDAAEAIKNGDTADLNNAIRQAEYNEELKAFDYVWSDVASYYDSLITDYCEDATNTPYTQFQTADEIYKDSYKSVITPKTNKNEEKKDLLRALLNI